MNTRLVAGTLGVVAAAGLLGAGLWSLRPLLEIIPLTKQLVGTTGALLDQTQQLKGGIADVRSNLGELKRQEDLLGEQETVTRRIVGGLGRQTELSQNVSGLLSDLLAAEKGAADQIRQADQAGAATLQTVAATQAQVQSMADQAGRIAASSRKLDGQLDRLHTELQSAADNFAVIGRLKEKAAQAAEQVESSAAKAKQQVRSWWQRAVEWMKQW